MQIAPPFGYKEVVPFLKTQKVRLLATGENLFWQGERWADGAYVPAYARRYPFCMARVNVNKVEQKDRLICVEKLALDEGGEAMLDAAGNATQKWKGVERMLAEYEADLERMREMCALLAEIGRA